MMRFGVNDVKNSRESPGKSAWFLLLQLHMSPAGGLPDFLDIDSSMKDHSI
jgi:hypothetical protein